jgi:hypothetical protein
MGGVGFAERQLDGAFRRTSAIFRIRFWLTGAISANECDFSHSFWLTGTIAANECDFSHSFWLTGTISAAKNRYLVILHNSLHQDRARFHSSRQWMEPFVCCRAKQKYRRGLVVPSCCL